MLGRERALAASQGTGPQVCSALQEDLERSTEELSQPKSNKSLDEIKIIQQQARDKDAQVGGCSNSSSC